MDGIAAVLLIPTVSQAKARDSGEVVMPQDKMNRDFFERWGFSEAVIDGDRAYLSGIVAGMRNGETDPTAAFDRAFRMIADVLNRSGSRWDDVIDLTKFPTDLPSQMENFVAVKQRYVRAPFPAWAAIEIHRLVPDDGLVEIKVVAPRSAKAR